MTTKIYTSLPGIRTRRRSLGLQAAPLAETLGVTRSAWSQWEAGATMPSAAYLPALAELLQCTIEELYEDGGPMRASAPTGETDGEEAAADDDGAD